MHPLPSARGPVSEYLLEALLAPPHELAPTPVALISDPLADEDLHLSLYLLYELHYRGLEGVDDRWEWSPPLLRLRATLEETFERALLEAIPLRDGSISPREVQLQLRSIADREGPPLSRYIKSVATVEQVREFVVHRSAYQLKEADPHSWAIPRLSGPAKAALVEIQADEYGQGRPEWVHAELFARAMRALSLDPTYGAYVEMIPGLTLATVNLMSMLGLHRRWRAAIVGHLALFEMTSSIPNRRYADGLRRLGFDSEATVFFDEHVVADAAHESVALADLAGGLVRQEPSAGPAILWGARVLDLLEERWATHLVGSWKRGVTSLLADLQTVGGPEADELMGSVAERLDLRSAAAAEGDGAAVAVDRSAVGSN
jgi:Iron-containing redox enzyme